MVEHPETELRNAWAFVTTTICSFGMASLMAMAQPALNEATLRMSYYAYSPTYQQLVENQRALYQLQRKRSVLTKDGKALLSGMIQSRQERSDSICDYAADDDMCRLHRGYLNFYFTLTNG